MKPTRINRYRYSPQRDAGRFFWLLLIVVFGTGGTTLLFIGFSVLPQQNPEISNQIPVTLVPVVTAAALIDSSITPQVIAPPQDFNRVVGRAVGQAAPDFTLPTIDGDQVTLSELKGQVVLINFWASWCAPCRQEMPELIRAYTTYQDRGLVILGLNATDQDRIENVQAFVNEFQIPFPVLLDQEGHVTNDLYNLLGFPMSVFVDRLGVIRHVQLGPMTGEQVDSNVLPLLEEGA